MKQLTVALFLIALTQSALAAPTIPNFPERCEEVRSRFTTGPHTQGPEEWVSWQSVSCGECTEPWGQIRCDAAHTTEEKVAYRLKQGDDYNDAGIYYCGLYDSKEHKPADWSIVGKDWEFRSPGELEAAYDSCFASLQKAEPRP